MLTQTPANSSSGMAEGVSRERILSAYPSLEPEDLDAALAYAAWRLEEREEDLTAA